jgi:fructokinase
MLHNVPKDIDVTALGEILIDFTFAGLSQNGQVLYERNAGGAPANVAAAVARLGGKSAFIGKTGDDVFGSFLKETLVNNGIETDGMTVSEQYSTTLAFVTLSPGGERSFSFYRNPGADTQLSSGELHEGILSRSRFLHIGSLSLTHEPARSATLQAIHAVKKAGGFISYDPNWRKPLWENQEKAIFLMKSIFGFADVVKVSDEELLLLFGNDDYSSGAGKILAAGARLVLVTLGPKGVFYKTRTMEGVVGAPPVSVVDTTGAGDSFVGGLIYRQTRRAMNENPLPEAKAELEADLRFANAVASLCVTKRGAISAMPSLSEVSAFLVKTGTQ